MALSRYYKHYEKVVPDYRLRAWLGDGFIGQTSFKGRTMRVVEQKVPMAFLKDQGRKPLILEKQGAGKLYYRLGLRYAPKSLRLPPAEQGFSVQREYEPVEGADTVTKLPGGKYRIKAGKYVRLRIVVPPPQGQRDVPPRGLRPERHRDRGGGEVGYGFVVGSAPMGSSTAR